MTTVQAPKLGSYASSHLVNLPVPPRTIHPRSTRSARWFFAPWVSRFAPLWWLSEWSSDPSGRWARRPRPAAVGGRTMSHHWTHEGRPDHWTSRSKICGKVMALGSVRKGDRRNSASGVQVPSTRQAQKTHQKWKSKANG